MWLPLGSFNKWKTKPISGILSTFYAENGNDFEVTKPVEQSTPSAQPAPENATSKALQEEVSKFSILTSVAFQRWYFRMKI